MEDFTIVVLGLASFLVGLMQLYQRAVTGKGVMQEAKNKELLDLGRTAIRCEVELKIAREQAIRYKKRYKRLGLALMRHATPDIIARIRDDLDKK